MELIFEKEHGMYVAEFQATGDFNIHLERNDRGILNILQSTVADGKYDSISTHNVIQDRVFDCDFTANKSVLESILKMQKQIPIIINIKSIMKNLSFLFKKITSFLVNYN